MEQTQAVSAAARARLAAALGADLPPCSACARWRCWLAMQAVETCPLPLLCVPVHDAACFQASAGASTAGAGHAVAHVMCVAT